MNILQIIVDVILALIIGFMVFLGVKRGFVKSFFKSTKIFFVIIVTILIGSLVVTLCQNLFVKSWFEGTISEKFVEKAANMPEISDFNDLKEEIPAFVQNLLPIEELEKDFADLSGNATDIARAMGEKVEGSLIGMVSSVIGYILAFVVSFIICTIAILIIEKIWEMPVLGWLNHIAGVLWGIASAYLWSSVAVFVIALIFGSEFVNGTALTRLVYNIGLFTF